MKTKKELNALKEDYEYAKVKSAQLPEEETAQVIGGLAKGRKYWPSAEKTTDSPIYHHNNCGGSIIRGGIFHNCRCDGCGEEHYFLDSFSYTIVYGIKPPILDD